MDTKACNLTENEIKKLIVSHGQLMSVDGFDNHIDRINYLNKRLKEFNKPAPVAKPEPAPQSNDGWV